MPNNITYLSKEQFIALNEKAIRLKKNRSVERHEYKRISDARLPVLFHMLHNDVEIRTQIGVSENSTAWLDMDIKDYNGLPSMSVDIENPNQPIL
ncbi:MAG: hypothetical protein CMI34_00170 [Opitutales bacterium]|nr:hypothetical protein [Opitutales bacterium]|tara:strand:+ start:4265 stop:4549 length:285 start_codon:yes stop_codon:yes gene_type:complete